MADIERVDRLMGSVEMSGSVLDEMESGVFKRGRVLDIPIGYTALWLALPDGHLAGAELIRDEGENIIRVTDEIYEYDQRGAAFLTREVNVKTIFYHRRMHQELKKINGLPETDSLKLVEVKMQQVVYSNGHNGSYGFKEDGYLAFKRFSSRGKVKTFQREYHDTLHAVQLLDVDGRTKAVEPYTNGGPLASSHRPLTKFNNDLIRFHAV